MTSNRRQLGAIAPLMLAGVAASVLMFWITDYGPGVSPDSVTYIETARNLVEGSGFYADGRPMTHFAPAYPLLLAAASIPHHGDILQASRVLGALLFGVNAVLFGHAVQLGTDHSLSATICAILFFLCSAPIFSIHSMAWSEAPMIAFALAALVLASLHIARPRRHVLLAASLCAGCAMATRYMGVALLPPIVLGLFFADRPRKHKVGDTLLFVAVASLPLTLWLIRNILAAGTAANRSPAIHVVGLGHAAVLLSTMYDFILPIRTQGWREVLQIGLAMVLFLALLALLRRKSRIVAYIRQNAHTVRIILPALCILFFFTYVFLLMISLSFFDAQTPLDYRILLPVLLMLAIAGISLAWSLSSALNRRSVWYAFLLLILFSAAVNSRWQVATAAETHRDGNEYTSRQWRNSETVAAVLSLSKDIEIYSNGKDVIRFLTDRAASFIPSVVHPGTLQSNLGFGEELEVICFEVRDGQAALVYFNSITWRWDQPTQEELESKCALPILARLDDGIIYAHQQTQAEPAANVP